MPAIFGSRFAIQTIFAVFLMRLGCEQATFTVANQITNAEPSIYRLNDLFLRADKIALVKVLSGDSESYEVPIYKGRVIDAIKGVSFGQTIYFGRYLGVEIGSEYILFLRDVQGSIQPKIRSGLGYGKVNYSSVFNEGYSSMLTSYQCVFRGSTISQQCDYGVRVCTDYIKIPESLETAPPDDADSPPFGCRWTRRDQFISILKEMVKPKSQ
jgi:hypothetical protein